MSKAEMETLADFLNDNYETIMDALLEAGELRHQAARCQSEQYPGEAQVDADKGVDYDVCRQSLRGLLGGESGRDVVSRVA